MANNNIGKRLLPVIIDEAAAEDPDRAWASLPIDDYDLERGFEDVSFAAFANAINKVAHCIESALGRSDNFETVMYLGVPDLRYYMLLYAVCKTGHKVLFSSHHNSLETHLSLMNQTSCRYLLLSRGVYAGDILEKRPMPTAELPELDDLLNLDDMAATFPYNKTYEEAKDDPFVIVHTSGTTGPPKPITYTHASMATVRSATRAAPFFLSAGFAMELVFLSCSCARVLCQCGKVVADLSCTQMDIQSEIPASEGREHFTWKCARGTRYLMIASPFHAISVVLAMTISAFGEATLLPGFRDRPVEDINDLGEIIKHSQAHTGFIPSFLMEIIARRDDAEDYIKQFQYLTYANGAQNKDVGHRDAAADLSCRSFVRVRRQGLVQACAVDCNMGELRNPDDAYAQGGPRRLRLRAFRHRCGGPGVQTKRRLGVLWRRRFSLAFVRNGPCTDAQVGRLLWLLGRAGCEDGTGQPAIP